MEDDIFNGFIGQIEALRDRISALPPPDVDLSPRFIRLVNNARLRVILRINYFIDTLLADKNTGSLTEDSFNTIKAWFDTYRESRQKEDPNQPDFMGTQGGNQDGFVNDFISVVNGIIQQYNLGDPINNIQNGGRRYKRKATRRHRRRCYSVKRRR
jgi:hypothetical protein